jgi:hypothetical protein
MTTKVVAWSTGNVGRHALAGIAARPDLVNRMTAQQADRGICIHCNRCMPTIYSEGGTHCPVITG